MAAHPCAAGSADLISASLGRGREKTATSQFQFLGSKLYVVQQATHDSGKRGRIEGPGVGKPLRRVLAHTSAIDMAVAEVLHGSEATDAEIRNLCVTEAD